jgi:class 3 adenylate cyclase
MLKHLFTEFDKSTQLNKVFKLYTIGDCYVVLGFKDARQRDPSTEAKNVIMMGFHMIEIIRNVREIVNFQDLDMRIGVHTVVIFL